MKRLKAKTSRAGAGRLPASNFLCPFHFENLTPSSHVFHTRMNFTTQAAQDITGKIERDPAEIRHWRQLLILCFDQKAVESLQVLQVVCTAIDQIWTSKRQQAKEAHEAAKQKQRTTGSREPLPPLAVTAIPLTGKQKDVLVKLAREPQSPELLFRFGRHLEQDFGLPQSAHAIYSRAVALEPEDDALLAKINEAIQRIDAQAAKHGETTEHMPKLDTAIAPTACSTFTGSSSAVHRQRRTRRPKCVSTVIPGMSNALPRTTLAVLRPTPGSVTSSSMFAGTSPSNRSTNACPRPMSEFALLR